MATEQAAYTQHGEHFARFVEQMRAAWAAGQDAALPPRAQGVLESLLQQAPATEAWVDSLQDKRPPARELYRDPTHGFVQMGHFHPENRSQGGVPHDHGPCWVLYGVYSGEIEITTYQRTDDGADPNKATLAVKETVRVKPGMVRPYLPGEIHSTRAIAPEGSVVMRFLSADLDRVERNRYDLKTGAVSRV
jgi:hypothetical protein